MKNDGMKATLNEETEWLLQTGMKKANAIFHEVAGTLK